MRDNSDDKMIVEETSEEEPSFLNEARRRFPVTTDGKLHGRVHALARRRARNKMRRVTLQKQRRLK